MFFFLPQGKTKSANDQKKNSAKPSLPPTQDHQIFPISRPPHTWRRPGSWHILRSTDGIFVVQHVFLMAVDPTGDTPTLATKERGRTNKDMEKSHSQMGIIFLGMLHQVIFAWQWQLTSQNHFLESKKVVGWRLKLRVVWVASKIVW